MPAKKLSPGLMSDLSRAAFKDGRKDYARLIMTASRDDIVAAMPDRKMLLEKMEELAFQEDADVFVNLLYKFSDDEGVLRAVLTGFDRDEKFCSQSDDGWGGPDPHNRRELVKKRNALQKFILNQLPAHSVAADDTQKTSRKQTPPHLRL
jgi:hypothetical protein